MGWKRFIEVLAVFTITLSPNCRVKGQCQGEESFEKITRVALEGPRRSPLLSGAAFDTKKCLQRCKKSFDCLGVELDYKRKLCIGLDNNLENSKIKVKPVRKPVNFFEKICITMPTCGKAWVLERVVGYEIEGYDDIIIEDVPSRLSCAELCLRERGLHCKSVEFNDITRQCKLSRQDRRSQPLHFRPATEHVHYIENQCNQVTDQDHCEYEEFLGQDIEQPDSITTVANKIECKRSCEKEQTFNCRSFSWNSTSNECLLSSDDQLSAGPSSVVEKRGLDFYQRTPCLDLRLDCSTNSMNIELRTAEPFQGRVFSQSFPNDCQVEGRGETGTTFKIGFEDTKCGVVDEGDGVLSNVIVVQHHPVIQRRGDKAIKVVCLFQTTNRTVSHGFNIDYSSFSGAVATAIVNATAPSPKIRLRIVDRNGDDVTGVRLGDELYLRLDLDETSIYGILARNLVAKNSDNSHSIQLLDERGCPVDPLIFPSLQPVTGSKSLQGKFEAFKFSEDSVVRFQLNVQFCLERCRPAQCGESITSYGKKRRRRDVQRSATTPSSNKTFSEDNEDHIYHEMPLQREIIVANSHVTQITGGIPGGEIFQDGDLICTSKEVLVAIIISSVVLQICLILVAIMCVILKSRKGHSPSSSSSLLTLTMSRNGRHSAFSNSHSNGHSENTLKSLRTNLRD